MGDGKKIVTSTPGVGTEQGSQTPGRPPVLPLAWGLAGRAPPSRGSRAPVDCCQHLCPS